LLGGLAEIGGEMFERCARLSGRWESMRVWTKRQFTSISGFQSVGAISEWRRVITDIFSAESVAG
jgi:hypothetical protein